MVIISSKRTGTIKIYMQKDQIANKLQNHQIACYLHHYKLKHVRILNDTSNYAQNCADMPSQLHS